ncbi:putative Kinase [Melia azedarach]|uniref:Kinase n=1 Tax=Melia azedarach TaxID=155640 RepID=A0ACC1Y5J4_MELAZ|nr:putative Kinase [Melia azedarach]
MAFHILILLQIILLLSPIKASEPSCNRTCGDADVNYPFGIGEGCYFDKNFEVTCDNSSGSPKASLNGTGLGQSSYISYASGTNIAVNISVISLNSNKSTSNGRGVNLSGSPFSFSQKANRFTARGCGNLSMIKNLQENNNSATFGGCYAICTCDPTQSQHSSCCDFSCAIPPNLKFFHADIANSYSRNILQECTSLLMVYEYWLFSEYQTNSTVWKDEKQVPAVLEWGKNNGSCIEYFNSDNTRCNRDGYCIIQLDSGFVCLCNDNRSASFQDTCRGELICNTTSGYNCSNCPHGYYLDYSSSNNDPECSPSKSLASFGKKSRVKYIVIGSTSGGLGMLFFIIGTWRLYKFVKQRKETKRKQKFFRRNGGLLLQQELSSIDGNIEKTKVFTSKELEKATDNFNMNRILGQGGQGTVYKGMLADGKIVAVKRSKVVDESKVEEFINEVVILSQINHRNVVQLLGCCLETEVPLLVYEFIPNGNLFDYIHYQSQEFPITWEMRLRIAAEVAGALSYLHSAASIPIYHRDIKSTNILLDDKYGAKISDFGTSRSMAIDQTHMTTQVHGTFGYLDPEYFRSSQFTDKSDVYSFGVVLAELLTGEKAIRLINSEEDKSLAAYFLSAMKENRLFEIVDAQVLKEAKKDDILTVATLTKKCMNLNGKKRPTMKEVTTELLEIKASNGVSIVQKSLEEMDYTQGDINSSRNFETGSSFTFSGSVFESATFSVDADPLISNKW